jgi:hypothetical protein
VIIGACVVLVVVVAGGGVVVVVAVVVVVVGGIVGGAAAAAALDEAAPPTPADAAAAPALPPLEALLDELAAPCASMDLKRVPITRNANKTFIAGILKGKTMDNLATYSMKSNLVDVHEVTQPVTDQT